jgi:hypothetical protein
MLSGHRLLAEARKDVHYTMVAWWHQLVFAWLPKNVTTVFCFAGETFEDCADVFLFVWLGYRVPGSARANYRAKRCACT